MSRQKKFERSGRFYVYILECSDRTYYTGYTKDLEKRIKEHNSDKRGAWYTRHKKPVRLVWSKKYRYFKPAFLMEKRIKELTRKQKEMVVKGRRLDKVLIEAGK